MAEINVLGAARRQSYINAEKEIPRFSYKITMCLGVLAITNLEYIRKMTHLLFVSNGVSAIVIKLIFCLFIEYPWITTCLFIGQYTKYGFLMVRHMSPVISVAFILQFILNPLFCGILHNYTSLTRHFFFLFHFNITEVQKCDAEVLRSREGPFAKVCNSSYPFNHTSLCLMRKYGFFHNDVLSDDVLQIAFGICLSFLLLYKGRNYTTFGKIFYRGCKIIFFWIAILPLFDFLKVPIHKTFYKFFFDNTVGNKNIIMQIVTFLGVEIVILTIHTPVLVMLGANLTSDKWPSTTALYITFLQCGIVIVLFFFYISHLLVIGRHYKVPIYCIGSNNFFESVLAVRRETTFLIFIDQGIHIPYFLDSLTFVLHKFHQLAVYTCHIMAIHFSVIQEFNIRKRWVSLTILLIICSYMHFGAHISVIDAFAWKVYVIPFIIVMNLFFSITFTYTVIFIYSVTELNKDMIFLLSKGMIPGIKVLVTFLPIMVTCYFVWGYNCYTLKDTWLVYNVVPPLSDWDLVTAGINLYMYYGMTVVPICFIALVALVQILLCTFKGNISEAFLPRKRYTPWSPPGEDLAKEREEFLLETAVKFKGDYYRCSHSCWLDNPVIAAEIKECERNYEDIATELANVNIKLIAPDIYEQFKDVLTALQEEYKSKVLPDTIVLDSGTSEDSLLEKKTS